MPNNQAPRRWHFTVINPPRPPISAALSEGTGRLRPPKGKTQAQRGPESEVAESSVSRLFTGHQRGEGLDLTPDSCGGEADTGTRAQAHLTAPFIHATKETTTRLPADGGAPARTGRPRDLQPGAGSRAPGKAG